MHTCWSLFRLLQSHWASSCSLSILSSFCLGIFCSWWSLSLEGPVILFYAFFSLFKRPFLLRQRWQFLSHLPSGVFSPSSQFLILSSYDMFLQSVFPYASDYVVHLMACWALSHSPETQAPWIQRPCVDFSQHSILSTASAWLTGVLGTTIQRYGYSPFICS